jgi:hypothetical protein
MQAVVEKFSIQSEAVTSLQFNFGSKREKAERRNIILAVELTSQNWCVAVFKCKPDNIRKVIVDFYGFVEDLENVQSLHFLIKDRLGDCLVFSFRVLVNSKDNAIVESKIAYKLGQLLAKEDFAVNPETKNPLSKYVDWSPDEKIAKFGQKKFKEFCDILDRLSKLVLWMIKNGYFDSAERVEVAHSVSWMLGCTEYGLLDTDHWEVGYYDRIEDKYCQSLKHDFPKK